MFLLEETNKRLLSTNKLNVYKIFLLNVNVCFWAHTKGGNKHTYRFFVTPWKFANQITITKIPIIFIILYSQPKTWHDDYQELYKATYIWGL